MDHFGHKNTILRKKKHSPPPANNSRLHLNCFVANYAHRNDLELKSVTLLYFADYACIKPTGLQDLVHVTAFIAHVRQFIFTRSKPMVGIPRLTGVTALVLKSQNTYSAGCAPKVSALVGGPAGLRKGVLQVNFPGQVEGAHI